MVRANCRGGAEQPAFPQPGEWVAALEKLGLGVRVAPVSEGTPFANVLFLARPTDRKINPDCPRNVS